MSYLTPSWDTDRISKDNKIIIKNLGIEAIVSAKKIIKKFAAK